MTPAEKLKAMVSGANLALPLLPRRNDETDGSIHYDVDDADGREVACTLASQHPHRAQLIALHLNCATEIAEWYAAASEQIWEWPTAYKRLDAAQDALKDAITKRLREIAK